MRKPIVALSTFRFGSFGLVDWGAMDEVGLALEVFELFVCLDTAMHLAFEGIYCASMANFGVF